jgi:hypothetical protein
MCLAAADLIHVFSKLPRDLNFIDHTSDIGWKEYESFLASLIDDCAHADHVDADWGQCLPCCLPWCTGFRGPSP